MRSGNPIRKREMRRSDLHTHQVFTMRDEDRHHRHYYLPHHHHHSSIINNSNNKLRRSKLLQEHLYPEDKSTRRKKQFLFSQYAAFWLKKIPQEILLLMPCEMPPCHVGTQFQNSLLPPSFATGIISFPFYSNSLFFSLISTP